MYILQLGPEFTTTITTSSQVAKKGYSHETTFQYNHMHKIFIQFQLQPLVSFDWAEDAPALDHREHVCP